MKEGVAADPDFTFGATVGWSLDGSDVLSAWSRHYIEDMGGSPYMVLERPPVADCIDDALLGVDVEALRSPRGLGDVGIVFDTVDGKAGWRLFDPKVALKRRVDPMVPDGVPFPRDEMRCEATVHIDEEGLPTNVSVAGCDAIYARLVEDAARKSKWQPFQLDGVTIKAITMWDVHYKITP